MLEYNFYLLYIYIYVNLFQIQSLVEFSNPIYLSFKTIQIRYSNFNHLKPNLHAQVLSFKTHHKRNSFEPEKLMNEPSFREFISNVLK